MKDIKRIQTATSQFKDLIQLLHQDLDQDEVQETTGL